MKIRNEIEFYQISFEIHVETLHATSLPIHIINISTEQPCSTQTSKGSSYWVQVH